MKKKLLFSTMFVLFLAAVFEACEKVPNTTYEDVKLIISTSCATQDCHDATTAAANIDCSSFYAMSSGAGGRRSILNTNSGNFADEVLVQKTMPPLGSLTQADLDLLQLWVDEGFPESK